MRRVKKQLHEWDENLKDDSLPTNAIGQPASVQCTTDGLQTGTHIRLPICLLCPFTPLFPFCLVSVRLLLQGGGLSAYRRRSAAPAAEDRQRHPETPL